MNMLPLALVMALSIRSPTTREASVDGELSAGMRWKMVEATALVEREDGRFAWGYELTGGQDLKPRWRVEFRTRFKEEEGIDRQSLLIGYTLADSTFPAGVGAGLTARSFRRTTGAVDFRLPLPGGSATLTTNFRQTSIWDVKGMFTLKIDEKLKPFLQGRYFSDGGRRDWQIKGGVEVIL